MRATLKSLALGSVLAVLLADPARAEGWHDSGGAAAWQVWPAAAAWQWGLSNNVPYVATNLTQARYVYPVTNWPAWTNAYVTVYTNYTYIGTATNPAHGWTTFTREVWVQTHDRYVLNEEDEFGNDIWYTRSTNYVQSNIVYNASGVLTHASVLLQPRDLWLIDLHEAAEERAKVCGVPAPDVEFYKSLRDGVVDFKAWLTNATPVFLDMNRADGSGHFIIKDPTVSSFPALTPTGACAILSAPTNYPDYTGYSQWNGIGKPQTNEYVQAGFSTLDYNNVQHLKDWMDLLVCIARPAGFTNDQYTWTMTTTNAGMTLGVQTIYHYDWYDPYFIGDSEITETGPTTTTTPNNYSPPFADVAWTRSAPTSVDVLPEDAEASDWYASIVNMVSGVNLNKESCIGEQSYDNIYRQRWIDPDAPPPIIFEILRDTVDTYSEQWGMELASDVTQSVAKITINRPEAASNLTATATAYVKWRDPSSETPETYPPYAWGPTQQSTNTIATWGDTHTQDCESDPGLPHTEITELTWAAAGYTTASTNVVVAGDASIGPGDWRVEIPLDNLIPDATDIPLSTVLTHGFSEESSSATIESETGYWPLDSIWSNELNSACSYVSSFEGKKAPNYIWRAGGGVATLRFDVAGGFKYVK